MSKLREHPQPSLDTLISRLVAGDVEAFGSIYRMFYNKLLRYGTIITPETEIVEDAIQDLFMWILENPQKIEKVQNFEVYLFQSLKKNLRERIKRKTRSGAILHQFSRSQDLHSPEENIEQQIIRTEEQAFDRNWVKLQLNGLPPRQKEIIFLRYYEGLSYDEIAEIVSTNNQVIRNYVARALKQIRQAGNLKKLLLLLFLY